MPRPDRRPTARATNGPGDDEPVVWYEGATLTTKRWLHADERGSVIALSDAGGASIAANRYDEYGIPAATNLGRFQYTGQAWLPELGLYYYKARMYAPTLGRFMQTDPIGYEDGINWYAYVANDPINNVDPDGKQSEWTMDRRYIYPHLTEEQREGLEEEHRKIGENAAEGMITGATLALPGGLFLRSARFVIGGKIVGRASPAAQGLARKFHHQITREFNRGHHRGLERAIRREARTGDPTKGKFHFQKGRDAVRWANNQIGRIAKNDDLSKAEKGALTRSLENFRNRIQDALPKEWK